MSFLCATVLNTWISAAIEKCIYSNTDKTNQVVLVDYNTMEPKLHQTFNDKPAFYFNISVYLANGTLENFTEVVGQGQIKLQIPTPQELKICTVFFVPRNESTNYRAYIRFEKRVFLNVRTQDQDTKEKYNRDSKEPIVQTGILKNKAKAIRSQQGGSSFRTNQTETMLVSMKKLAMFLNIFGIGVYVLCQLLSINKVTQYMKVMKL